jgi:hypothetical protein
MVSDKSYTSEQRLNALWNHLGPAPAGSGNGQRITRVITANQTISSTSDTVIGANSVPMSWTVVPGLYLIQGMVNWVQNVATVAQGMGFGGVTISNGRVANSWTVATQQAQGGVNYRELNSGTGFGTAAGQSPAYTVAIGSVEWFFHGSLLVGSTGTLSVLGAEGTNGDTWTIGAYSYATLESVGQTS